MDKIENKNSNSRFERDAFTAYQNFLYKRCLYGVGVYDKEELQTMNADKRKRIEKVNKRCQFVLNMWKQELCNEYTNRIFQTFFPKTEIGKFFFIKHKNTVDPGFTNTLSFKDMGISKKQIVEKLILEGVLPKNFHDLKHAPTKEEKI